MAKGTIPIEVRRQVDATVEKSNFPHHPDTDAKPSNDIYAVVTAGILAPSSFFDKSSAIATRQR